MVNYHMPLKKKKRLKSWILNFCLFFLNSLVDKNIGNYYKNENYKIIIKITKNLVFKRIFYRIFKKEKKKKFIMIIVRLIS